MKARYTLFILILVFYGCQQKLTTKKEITDYISDPENGLSISQNLNNNIKVTLAYIPMSLLHISNNKLRISNKHCYFSFRISRNHSQLLRQLDFNLYSKMITVLSFRMQDYVTASNGKSAIVRPTQACYQQTFGLTNYDELLLVFEADKILSSKYFQITIDECGLGLGNLDFKYNSTDIIKFINISSDIT